MRIARVLSGPWAVVFPAALAGVLGWIGIADKSLWLDEAFSVSAARMPTLDLLVYLWRNELHAAPYYILLHVWTLLGDGEAAVRSLSVVFGVVGVVATYAVGRRYGVGLAAAVVLAVSPMFVQFEQEARVYTLLVAWAAISTLAYLRLAERRTRLRAAIYVLTAAAMPYVHPIGLFVIVAHAVWALRNVERSARRDVVLMYLAVALAWLPMLRFMLLHRDKIAWIRPLTVTDTAEHLVALGGGTLVAGALLVLLALGIRRDLPALWLLFPVAGVLLLSVLVQPTLQSRYLIGTLPAIAIIVARNRPIALAVLIALSLATNYAWYTEGVKDDWRAGVAYVRARALPGDGIVFTPNFARPAFEYYGEIGEPLYPAVPWDELYMPGLPLPSGIAPDVDNPRIWQVASHGEGTPRDVAETLARYTATERVEFGPNGPRITLLVRNGEP